MNGLPVHYCDECHCYPCVCEDITDEGCEMARRHFEPTFGGEEWDDVEN